MARPRLALVPGEPAGVGPELCVAALQRDHGADITVFGDRAALERAARTLGLPLDGAPGHQLVQILHPVLPPFGSPDPTNAASVIAALRAAADACSKGELDGMVTGPVHKAAIDAGGIAYTGTTGLLAEWTGREVVMMLANDVVRVALATVHIPLRDVPGAISAESLERTIGILHRALQADFGHRRVVYAPISEAGFPGLIGAVGLLLYLESRTTAHRRGYVMLRRMGLTPGVHRRALILEVGAPVAAQRRTPDGTVLSWRLAAPYPLGLGGVQPFLLDWQGGAHPSDADLPWLELTQLRVQHPDPVRVGEVLRILGTGSAIEVTAGPAPRLTALLSTPAGDLVLR